MTLNNWIISWMFQTKSTCGMAQGKYQTASPCADGLNCWNCTIPFGKRSGCMNWFLWARKFGRLVWHFVPFGKGFGCWCFADFKSFWQGFLIPLALHVSNPFGKDSAVQGLLMEEGAHCTVQWIPGPVHPPMPLSAGSDGPGCQAFWQGLPANVSIVIK